MTTLNQLSETLNLSKSTISRVLNNDKNLQISPETRKSIIQEARRSGYIEKIKKNKPNVMLYYCKSNASEENIDPFYKEVKENVINYAKTLNINLFSYLRNEVPDTAVNINGIVAIGTYNIKEIDFLTHYSTNIVFINSFPDISKFDSVVVDDQTSMKNAIDFFVAKGISNIGFIGGNEFVPNEKKPRFNQRLFYFKYYMELYGFSTSNIYIGEYNSQSSFEIMNSIIEKNILADAYVCASDPIAIGALNSILLNKIDVPNDVQILGFDNERISQTTILPLSTISINKENMAKVALDRVISNAKDIDHFPQRIVLPTEIIERSTTK